jgi:hypothetical protein
LARIASTLGITSGPTPSITTSAWPSSSDITPVTRSMISRCSGVLISSMRLPPLTANGPGDSLQGVAQHALRLEGRRERVDLRLDVVAHPRARP